MASRRAKSKTLTQTETDRLVAAAIALNEACCKPLLNIRSEHYRALNDLNAQLVATLRIVTGETVPPWVSWTKSVDAPK
jgi:hypothetical protein